MKKNILVVGLLPLLIISTLTHIVNGYDSRISEGEKFIENLNFICSNNSQYSKINYYIKYIFNINNEIIHDKVDEKITSEPQLIMMNNGPMNSPWPMKCHDNHHTSQSPFITANNPYDEIWKFECRAMEDSLVIDNNGTIYFGDMSWDLYALNPDGTLKWKYETGGIIWSAPAIAEDGTIYMCSWDDYLHAIKPDGTRKWRFNANHADISSSPAIADDGTIYFGTLWSLGDGGRIHAVNPDGTEKWYYQTGWHISSDPAIGEDGTVYIGGGDKYLYAMNTNGTLKWRFKTGDEIHGNPSIAEDGTIYIGSWDDYLYAIYPNGTMRWKFKLGFGTSGNPAIGYDGTIYVGSSKLYAVYPNGTLKWKYLGANQNIDKSSPAISADGIVYIGTMSDDLDGGFILAVNADGTERWSKKIANYGCESSPAIGSDGTIYIGSTYKAGNGFLYAFNRAELEAEANGPYYGLKDEPIQFTGFASGGYTPYSYHWDFGDTYISDEQNPQHTYTNSGNYTVTLTVTDDTDNTSDDTTWAWIQDGNSPPDIPNIDGPVQGTAGKTYPYTFLTTDPEGLPVWYFIDWDDGTNTGWIGPYNSGVIVSKSHKWTNQGDYTIKCKSKDPYDDESSYSELKITMPRKKELTQPVLLKYLNLYPFLKILFQKIIF